ncbi:hypothetical protein QE447_003598 [Stenotrophomonas sp. SORGH_AS282]|nr:hypothetical protein [Stenotrophomonas sp. SORGH_AS_0282]MDQ1191095.1 hypothetical protein [Stenotrophomonas sp. SORGH_AS_0282]
MQVNGPVCETPHLENFAKPSPVARGYYKWKQPITYRRRRMRTLLLVVTILAALVPGVWCFIEVLDGNSLSFSSVTAFLPAVVGLLAYLNADSPAARNEVMVARSDNAEPAVAAHDLVLFDKFQLDLPFDPTVKLLREANFDADYRSEWLQPLNRFVEDWDNPNYEFIDASLEDSRAVLYAAARSLAFVFARETVPHDGNEGWRTVYPWRQRGGPRPEHIIESARVLNEAARAFVPVYEQFVRLARERLKVAA